MAVCVDGKLDPTKILPCEPLGSAIDRGGKKKTKSKGPALIFTLTEVDRQKLEEEKAKSIVAKAFLKIASFSYLKQVKISEGATTDRSLYADNSESNLPRPSTGWMSNPTPPSSSVVGTYSFPPSSILRSALRGGHEDKGLGPRPKLRVRWAPDVQEPTGTNISQKLANQIELTRKEYPNLRQNGIFSK